MEPDTITLTEITSPTNGRGSHLYLETRLKDEGKEGFVLTVLDGEHVWEGTISEDDLDEQCTKLKMDYDTYVRETKAAFTQEDVADQSFECQFKSAATSAQLSWKKMPARDIKYHLGSVTLRKCPTSAAKICELLSHCIARTQALQARVTSLESDNERLSIERQNALKRLDKCVTAKEQLETDLYSKFVLVLNSKKERIQHLEEQLQSTESGQGASNSQASRASKEENGSLPASRKTARNRNGETSRQTNDSLSEDFDVNTEEEIGSPKKQKKAALSKKEESFLKLSEDESEESKLAPTARRPQRQKATKKQTPSKPTLPRVSSGDAQERPSSAAGRRSSLRKSGSGGSNKFSDNLDPDDLLNNF